MKNRLQDIAIGGYLPGRSILHRLDPRVKLLCFALALVGVFSTRTTAGLITGAVFVTLIAALCGVGFPVWRRSILKFSWMLTIAAAAHLFLTSEGRAATAFGIDLPFTREGARASVAFTLNLAEAIALSMALTFTTTPRRLTQGLKRLAAPLKRFRVPVDDMALVLLLAMRFAPALQWEAQTIVDAQKARGVDFSRGGPIARARTLTAVFVPSLMAALRRSDTLAAAMSARGFKPGATMTEYRPLRVSGLDWAALAVTSAVVATQLLLSG